MSPHEVRHLYMQVCPLLWKRLFGVCPLIVFILRLYTFQYSFLSIFIHIHRLCFYLASRNTQTPLKLSERKALAGLCCPTRLPLPSWTTLTNMCIVTQIYSTGNARRLQGNGIKLRQILECKVIEEVGQAKTQQDSLADFLAVLDIILARLSDSRFLSLPTPSRSTCACLKYHSERKEKKNFRCLL